MSNDPETVTAEDAMRALVLALRQDNANIVVLPLLPAAAAVPILADVAPDPSAPGSDPDLDSSAPLTAELDPEVLAQQVLEAVATQLGLAESEVDPGLPLVELGVDSIMTVRLRRQLEKQTGLSLPPTLLWEHPTASAVSTQIADMLAAAREPQPVD